jgi:hypothetical protein
MLVEALYVSKKKLHYSHMGDGEIVNAQKKPVNFHRLSFK